MKLAAVRVGRGERTSIPDRLAFHLVAKAYGTTPAAVRAWPVDDFLDARAFLVTDG
jgi:hypothetical protein